MTSKKSTQKSKKDDSDRNINIDILKQPTYKPITYVISDVFTNVHLLKSTEETVRMQALLGIIEQCDKSKSYLKKAFECGVLKYLIPYIYILDNTIIRQTLRLIISLIKIKKAFNTFTIQRWLKYVEQFSCMYFECDDIIIREYAANILRLLTKNHIIGKVFIKEDVMNKMFFILTNEPDIDILNNTLGIICNTMDLVMAPTAVETYKKFDLNVIECFIESCGIDLAATASLILLKIAKWRELDIQPFILDTGIMNVILPLILDMRRTRQREHLLNLLSIMVETYDIAVKLINTLQFLRFCTYVTTCHPNAILPASRVFLSLTTHFELIQQLFDFSTEDAVLTLLRYKNLEVISNVAQTVGGFLQNKYCCEKLTVPAVIETFMKICDDPKVDMLPHKNLIFMAIFEYLRRSTKGIDIIISLRGIEMVVNIFQEQFEQIKEGGYSYILDVIYIFAMHNDYTTLIMNRYMYANLIDLCETKPEQILHIINQYIQYEDYQEFFLRLRGPKLIVKLLSEADNQLLIRELFVYIKNIIVYKRMVLPLLRAGLMPLLKSIRSKCKYDVASTERLINTLYNLYLPLKFHETRRLEISDHIISKFYLVRESTKCDFPFLDILQTELASPRYVIYVIDVEFYKRIGAICGSENSLSNLINLSNRHKGISTMTIRSLDIFSDDEEVKEDPEIFTASDLPSDEVDIYKCMAPDKENRKFGFKAMLKSRILPARLYNMGICSKEHTYRKRFTEACPALEMLHNPTQYMYDTLNMNLISYIEDLDRNVNDDFCPCVTKKFKIIANYVHRLMTVPEEIEINSKLIYELHIQGIKNLIQSSIIPLELVSCGRHCERALFFKFFCDMLNLPATLVKGDNLIFYNEVALVDYKLNVEDPNNNNLVYYVVDLLYDIGNFMEVGTKDASLYITGNDL